MSESDTLLKRNDAAKVLGICTRTLMRHVAAGEIPYISVGRGVKRKSIRFTPSDIAMFKHTRMTNTPCLSTQEAKKASTNTTSNAKVFAFSDLLAARQSETPSPLKPKSEKQNS